MLPIPRWALKYIKFRECPYCNNRARLKGVVGVGIREQTGQVNSDEYILTIEYMCKECDKKSIFLAQPDENMSKEDILESVIQSFKENSNVNKNKKSYSKISNREVNNLMKNLEKYDVFKSIGISKEELDSYEERSENK